MTGYIAVEGVEGAGKSTVVAALAEHWRAEGHEVITVREPGGSAPGEAIRRILLHGDDLTPWAEALLFAAQRAQLAVEVITPAVARGATVLGDRSVYSSLAYQGVGRGLGVEAVRAVNRAGLGDVWPDLVVLLRIDTADGLARQTVADRIGAAGNEFSETVAGAFDALAAAEPDRFVVVDVDGLDAAGVLAAVLAGIRERR